VVAPSRSVVIRRSTLADAESGARCHAACWAEAYAGIVEPDRLQRLTSDISGRTEAWRDQLARGRERWLAVDGETVVGFSSAGLNRDDDLPHLVELYACYVRAQYWGSGLGARLMDAAIGGTAPASVWVFEANARARAFYRKHGFVEDGSSKPEPLFVAEEIRMVRGG
jgi:GNAT superfamily N-acetyltransferase